RGCGAYALYRSRVMPRRFVKIAGTECCITLPQCLVRRLVFPSLLPSFPQFGSDEPVKGAMRKLWNAEGPARKCENCDDNHDCSHAVANSLADRAPPHRRLPRMGVAGRPKRIRTIAIGTAFAAQQSEIDEEPGPHNQIKNGQPPFEASPCHRTRRKTNVSRQPAGEE